MLVWFWLGLIILFLVIEAVTVGLATIWFAAGALAADFGADGCVFSGIHGAFVFYQAGCGKIFRSA